ncbi:MAG: ribbon-helix-helix protein, CopG family [Acidobacteria bacterium]|nr:ribbon-helix-helix protein, CopG family [Acidobacteriota bacterium]
MSTTVHIPPALLKTVDCRARALGVSRNRLIVRALERAVSERVGWAPEFLEQLRNVDGETSAAAVELLEAVTRARRSTRCRRLSFEMP